MGELGQGGGNSQPQLNLRSAWPILTLHQEKIACGAVYYDSAFGGKDSESDMDMGDDYMYTYTLSFSLSFSGSPSFLSDTLALSRSFSFSLCLSFGVFLSHTQRFLQPWMWGWVLRGLAQSLNVGMGTERFVTKCGMRISRYLLIQNTVCRFDSV